jgi:hypothetical protein
MPSRPYEKKLSASDAARPSTRSNTNSLQAQVIVEQRKEIVRLQKLLAKLEVKKESEIALLKAKLAEEKKNKIQVVVNRFDAAA